jgi:outer membrane murein-binding lipoprotein Lpp
MTKLLFITALALSACAAYYSVMGLLAIFAAAVIPIFIMGSLLEAAKLVVASWLYRSWNEIPKLMKVYFTTALIILMLLTSMGIFGYLSKAHLDQAVPTGDIAAKLSLIDEKIKTEKENLNAARKELNQLDQQVDQTISRTTDSAGADRAIAIRRGQQKDRARILSEIGTTQAKIAKLNEERAPIASEVRKVEAEVGPIKYIAALIYGDSPEEDVLEKAVRWVIIMIVMVFDPLAVLMLVAANWNMKREQELIQPETPEPITIPPTPLPEESKSIIKDFFKPKDVKVETHHHATTKHIIELDDGVMVDDMTNVQHFPEKPLRQPLR